MDLQLTSLKMVTQQSKKILNITFDCMYVFQKYSGSLENVDLCEYIGRRSSFLSRSKTKGLVRTHNDSS